MTRADRPTSPLRCWRIVCVVRIWMFVFLPRGSKLLTQATNWSNALSATRDHWKARGGGYVVPPRPPSASSSLGRACRCVPCFWRRPRVSLSDLLLFGKSERRTWGPLRGEQLSFFFLYPWLPDNQHAPWQKQTWATGRALPHRHTREIFSVWGFIWLQAAREPNR